MADDTDALGPLLADLAKTRISVAFQSGSHHGVGGGLRTLSVKRFALRTFWKKVRRSGSGCWGWKGPVSSGGYGVANFSGRNATAHRVAYTLLRGPVPAGLTLDHLCRNRGCVNPWHLEATTIRTNTVRGHLARGEAQGSAKLTETDVIEIRRRLSRGEQQRPIAMEFGVSHGLIGHISTRRIWQHVKEA